MKFSFLWRQVIFVMMIWPLLSQAQADSVSAGRLYRSKSKTVITSNSNHPAEVNETERLTYLLKGVMMQSTSGPFHQKTMTFGKFTNNSPYTLTITLIHMGGSSHRHAIVHIDGAEVGHTEGGHITFQVPSGSSYSWNVKNEHAITVTTSGNLKNKIDTGLPTENNFLFPQRLGEYKGCIYSNAYVGYLYAVSLMSDGTDAWGYPMFIPKFGNVVYGPAPLSPVSIEPCSSEDLAPPPPDEKYRDSLSIPSELSYITE